MDLELKGKVAIVTGGSKGIGKAIGKELAAEGAHVALVSRSLGTLEPAVKDITAAGGGRVQAFACDTADDQSVKAMVEAVVKAFGRVDILVNCAAKPSGQSKPPTLAEITTEEFWDHMNTKVMGYLRTAREVVRPHHQRQRPRRAPHRHHHRLDPQRRRGGIDQEPRRRVGPARHQRRLRAPGLDAHGGDSRRRRRAGEGPRHHGGRGRAAARQHERP
jgi:NAD(P)-dependent dehydrogenase (short-subunit alcohol dehydrogenase family)